MADTKTVSQLQQSFNSMSPRCGVITLSGYGISVRVDRGHLVLEDGIGPARCHARFPRVGHNLRRLVVIGSDGIVSLAAIRWLADQNAAFVMLDRLGSVLATSGPVRPSDARLRRAQTVAHQSDMALRIARELIHQKLVGQEQIVRKYFRNTSSAQMIASARERLGNASTGDELRVMEANAASAYWGAWRDLPVTFPRVDLHRVPNHWQRFGSRMSALTHSPRLASNPPNAMLNYLYALLESEARLALATLGLDPGLGVMHRDSRSRDSLACDLMEPVRPQVDGFLLEWLSRARLRRAWFLEERDGNCRLTSSLTARLSETSERWAYAVAPYAEGIVRSLWSLNSKRPRIDAQPTRLTQQHKREARGVSSASPARLLSAHFAVCGVCGTSVKADVKYCVKCVRTIWRENIVETSRRGRLASHSPEAEALRSKSQKRQAAALKAWNPLNQPKWLDMEKYQKKILHELREVPVSLIMGALHISKPYALSIRSGDCIPHPRHWLNLAKLVNITS